MNSMTIVRAAVLGLAAGDALSWPAAQHREFLLPERRIPVLRFLDTFSDQHRSTTRPYPHVHSSPPPLLRPLPSDDVEWFMFAARAQLAARDGVDLRPEALVQAWSALAERRGDIRARTGTQIALANLAAGLVPPASGNDNPHYFDDIACVRAVAAGLIWRHDDELAAEAARVDAEVTHARDGVWCATATAVLVARLARGEAVAAAVEACLSWLPAHSWSRRTAVEAIDLASSARAPLSVAMRLQDKVVDKIYSYAVSAPETLALLLAHLNVSTTAEGLMLGAFAHARNADALPALAGAVAGLAFGVEWLPADLAEDMPVLDGVCLPALRGASLAELVTSINATAVEAR